MAGIDPHIDPRGARWEQRLHWPVLIAAWVALPTVFLYFAEKSGWLEILVVVVSWGIWLTFLTEAVIMLTVVANRRAWIRGHLFGLAILVMTLPALTHILEGLLAARALSSLQGARVLQVLYLAKAAKLLKSAQVLRTKGHEPRHPLLLTLFILLLSVVAVGIGHKIVTHDKDDTTPFHGFWHTVDVLPHWAIAFIAAGIFALLLGALTARTRRPRQASGKQG
jgi:hypothetical protein